MLRDLILVAMIATLVGYQFWPHVGWSVMAFALAVLYFCLGVYERDE